MRNAEMVAIFTVRSYPLLRSRIFQQVKDKFLLELKIDKTDKIHSKKSNKVRIHLLVVENRIYQMKQKFHISI